MSPPLPTPMAGNHCRLTANRSSDTSATTKAGTATKPTETMPVTRSASELGRAAAQAPSSTPSTADQRIAAKISSSV